jgi:hypothetical protein
MTIQSSPPSTGTARRSRLGGKTREDDKITQQVLDTERDAWRAWLTTHDHHGRRHRHA